MKLHYFLFATMLVAGAFITNFKASYYENQGRTPSSVVTPENSMKDFALNAAY
jgi:hypothetical protein